ncbi:MAG: hypothetical protein WAW34_14345 [Rhodoferax sp.]
MSSCGLIPRHRLKWIPTEHRLAHEYCYFLHDESVRLLVEYEKAEAHVVSLNFASKEEAKLFKKVAKIDSIEALRAISRHDEARRVILNTITMALVSDCMHHVYEALQCMEKRKSIVAFNLLRKPLMDNLLYLSWMLGDEDSFFNNFMEGDPALLTQKQLGNRRVAIIADALRQTALSSIFDANFIVDSIFEAKNAQGLYGVMQHAVHLVTAQRIEVRTAPQNFNFVFKSHADNDVYDGVYELLPPLLLYLAHVVLGLFQRIKPMDEGAKSAFQFRTIHGLSLIGDVDEVRGIQELLTGLLQSHLSCGHCDAPLTVTAHNAARILLTDSCRCTSCRRAMGLPFSWLF